MLREKAKVTSLYIAEQNLKAAPTPFKALSTPLYGTVP